MPVRTPMLETRRFGLLTHLIYKGCTIGTIERRSGQYFVTTQRGYQGNQDANGELWTLASAKAIIWAHSDFAQSGE